jgi:hypothetical protein
VVPLAGTSYNAVASPPMAVHPGLSAGTAGTAGTGGMGGGGGAACLVYETLYSALLVVDPADASVVPLSVPLTATASEDERFFRRARPVGMCAALLRDEWHKDGPALGALALHLVGGR